MSRVVRFVTLSSYAMTRFLRVVLIHCGGFCRHVFLYLFHGVEVFAAFFVAFTAPLVASFVATFGARKIHGICINWWKHEWASVCDNCGDCVLCFAVRVRLCFV